ncbi:MAG: phosphodiester glycosidase family protein, partial [Ignavibacteria bacterium]
MKKFFQIFYFINLCLFCSSQLLADDSTVVNVGPGIRYHSVYKTSVGPYNIKILEIDITHPKNKIETVLAKDVLGTGFEKTSSMAKRKSRSGHIVIGAVNADFFGISDPYNPYTFLVGSMILNNEYTFGRISQRPSFAIDTLKRLIIDDLSFSATIKTKQGYSKSISSLNDTVRTNSLVMFNKYFGNSTKTNNTVTELRLKRVSPLVIGDTVKFAVKAKNVGLGNITYNSDEYVLSGNGTAKAFLDSTILVNDTINIVFNTNPFRGQIYSMTGGGPTLVINGTIPSGLQTAVHPRTAVGFNQDSTKIFFVTVDGRQPGFSVGMSLPELANYMLSIGCWNAVNLDGGGSTTMVVRNRVVNSPSDAAGERSVANA